MEGAEKREIERRKGGRWGGEVSEGGRKRGRRGA